MSGLPWLRRIVKMFATSSADADPKFIVWDVNTTNQYIVWDSAGTNEFIVWKD